MPTFSSNDLLTQLQQDIEKYLQTVTAFQMLPPKKMLQPPAPGKWSAAQCLEHLNSYGRYYLPAIRQSIREAQQKELTTTKDFTTSWLGNFFTELMTPKGEAKAIKKMKAPSNHSPSAELNSDAVIATFIQQQETLLNLLEHAKAVNLRKTKTPISISRLIKLPLGDTFRFLIMHEYRHLLQAQRALAKIDDKVMTVNAV